MVHQCSWEKMCIKLFYKSITARKNFKEYPKLKTSYLVLNCGMRGIILEILVMSPFNIYTKAMLEIKKKTKQRNSYVI